MKCMMWCTLAAFLALPAAALPSSTSAPAVQDKSDGLDPWLNKYCISFFNKARSAKILPVGRWQVSMKYQEFDMDQKEKYQGHYNSMPSGRYKDQDKWTLCIKYGWIKDHQIAVGIPYCDNRFNYGSVLNNSSGVGNIFIFDKWSILKETNNFPAVSVDFWYYFPSGDPGRMLGTDDDAYKVTTEVSKAWKDFSLHLNPGYKWDKKDGNNNETELNAAILFTSMKTLWPAIEYNYLYKEDAGHSQDILPGLIWKYRKGGSIKAALQINVDSTFSYRDRVGLMFSISQHF
ncbi:MAG: hypothetical protein JXB18_09270 [Sedimentisphaerales bacterium]|nr:hypothetical protein [Sedimentisphaerales bacterium]